MLPRVPVISPKSAIAEQFQEPQRRRLNVLQVLQNLEAVIQILKSSQHDIGRTEDTTLNSTIEFLEALSWEPFLRDPISCRACDDTNVLLEKGSQGDARRTGNDARNHVSTSGEHGEEEDAEEAEGDADFILTMINDFCSVAHQQLNCAKGRATLQALHDIQEMVKVIVGNLLRMTERENEPVLCGTKTETSKPQEETTRRCNVNEEVVNVDAQSVVRRKDWHEARKAKVECKRLRRDVGQMREELIELGEEIRRRENSTREDICDVRSKMTQWNTECQKIVDMRMRSNLSRKAIRDLRTQTTTKWNAICQNVRSEARQAQEIAEDIRRRDSTREDIFELKAKIDTMFRLERCRSAYVASASEVRRHNTENEILRLMPSAQEWHRCGGRIVRRPTSAPFLHTRTITTPTRKSGTPGLQKPFPSSCVEGEKAISKHRRSAEGKKETRISATDPCRPASASFPQIRSGTASTFRNGNASTFRNGTAVRDSKVAKHHLAMHGIHRDISEVLDQGKNGISMPDVADRHEAAPLLHSTTSSTRSRSRSSTPGDSSSTNVCDSEVQKHHLAMHSLVRAASEVLDRPPCCVR